MAPQYVKLRRTGVTVSESSPQRIQFLMQHGYVLVEDAPAPAQADTGDALPPETDEASAGKKGKGA